MAANESAELAPLTPRPAPATGTRRRFRRIAAGVAAAAVAVAVVMLTANLLGDSALFFYNADEAVQRRDELGSQRFRVQGTPLEEPADGFAGDRPAIGFSIGFNAEVIDVVHIGDPPELFQPGVPVVLEGAWTRGVAPVGDGSSGEAWHFASDRMLVKHDNDYRKRDDYDKRVAEADQTPQES